MTTMLSYIAAVIVGLALLVWSADRFVDGAASLAHRLGVSIMIIGITVVGFGTSAPEIVVSIMAVINDTPDLAIGNALGSNIANIGLILGVTAILVPVPVASRLFRTEYPLLLLGTAVMVWALFDLNLDLVDGVILLGLLVLCLYYLVREHRAHPSAYSHQERESEEIVINLAMPAAITWVLIGLVVLVASSRLLVWGASNIALVFGVSELLIGLTIVALGTSLPELAASIASLKKGTPDLAVGNVIGSNLFNSLAVVGLPAVLTTFSVETAALMRDVPITVALTLLLIVLSRFPSSLPGFLTRSNGFILFGCFVVYQSYLYYEVATR